LTGPTPPAWMELQGIDKVLRNGGHVCHNCRIEMDQQYKAFEQAAVPRLNIDDVLFEGVKETGARPPTAARKACAAARLDQMRKLQAKFKREQNDHKKLKG
jgi:hypothetical protein